MAIICPYCQSSMNVKTPRAGRFTPKCGKCGKTFQLVVTLNPEPHFQVSALPGVSSASFDPNVTAPSAAEMPRAAQQSQVAGDPDMTAPLAAGLASPQATLPPESVRDNNADFSVASSVGKSAAPAADPDVTTALDQTAPLANAGANLDATEADAGPPAAAVADGEMPSLLGGYQIVKELGRGGMGAVYLARQVSLDRPVALKVMNPQWASNPNFLVRFTREAYAAAQLVHHNIVQVYDFGNDKGINYFSMEFVEGQSLGDLLKKNKGKVPCDLAAGYILQAARGLKFAHDRGMIHRDIKPDNLMLNNQGVVKVADLGLVRTPGAEEKPLSEQPPAPVPNRPASVRSLSDLSNVTMANQAMGTPSFMAPEQARDATKVDQRADIYSLGCTLYVLVTGKPVFSGKTPLEVMTRHASDPVTPPEVHNKEVPKALSDIILRMLAKNPDDRYADMQEVIVALESFLGLQGQNQQTQTEQHVRTLEKSVKEFLLAPAARLRSFVLLGFFGGTAALFVLLALLGFWLLSSIVLGLGVMTALAYFVVDGLARRGYLFRKIRDLLLSSSWAELGKIALGVLLFVGVLWLVGGSTLFAVWLLCGALAIGLALGMHYSLDRKIQAERAAALEPVEEMLRTLRLRGLSEEALHEFVSKYSGENWEEFFEALFGYEAKLTARAKYGVGPKGPRPRFAAWRDPIIRWIDNLQSERQKARERKHLQALEQKNLEAQGLDAATAREQAEAVAGAMVQKAAEIRKEADEARLLTEVTVAPNQAVSLPASKAPPPRRVIVQDLLEVGKQPLPAQKPAVVRLDRLLAAPFGSTVRFVVGAVLLLVGMIWMNANNLLPSANIANIDDPTMYAGLWQQMQEPQNPLRIPLMPASLLTALCSVNAVLAGLALLLSSIWRSWKIGLLVLLGAAIMVFGPVSGLLPALGPLTPHLAGLAVGGGVVVLGFLFGRDV